MCICILFKIDQNVYFLTKHYMWFKTNNAKQCKHILSVVGALYSDALLQQRKLTVKTFIDAHYLS